MRYSNYRARSYLYAMKSSMHPPTLNKIEPVLFPEPMVRRLSGGIPLYLIPGPSQDLLKLDCLFLVGRVHEKKALTARAACRLIREGTALYTGESIAERTDYFGGTISAADSMDHSGLTLQCLSRFFGDLIPLLAEMILRPSFPEKEVQAFKFKNIQRLEEDLSKNEVVAYRELTGHLFGQTHPYGYNSTKQMYEGLNRNDIVDYWETHYTSGNALLILSGTFGESHIMAIDAALCSQMRPGRSAVEYPEPHDLTTASFHIPNRNDSHQNAIRVGRRLFGRCHPDFYPLIGVNMLLGGYFGSRLMMQIREEQGLTYNIYSHIDALRHDGYFYISAEVSREQVQPTLEEIRRQLLMIIETPVPLPELEMMKRFSAGHYLHLLDGPFSQSETLRNLLVESGDHHHFNEMILATQSLEPQQIQQLAAKYLHPDAMLEVVVG